MLLPFKDEAAIKSYLLHSDERAAVLAAQGVQPTCIKGALAAHLRSAALKPADLPPQLCVPISLSA